MKYTQIEIRQPFALPTVISVPTYPKLEELEAQLTELNEEVLTAAGEVAALSQEKNALDYQAQLVTATAETFARLEEVRQALTRFEARHAAAKAHAGRIREELEGLQREIAWRFYRRGLLNTELTQAVGPSGEMRAYHPGEKQQRPRVQVLSELNEVVGWLAVWSGGDPMLVKEAAELGSKLAEARQ